MRPGHFLLPPHHTGRANGRCQGRGSSLEALFSVLYADQRQLHSRHERRSARAARAALREPPLAAGCVGASLPINSRHTSITDAGLASFLPHCPNLRVLDISNSTVLTDAALLCLSTGAAVAVHSRVATPKLHSLAVDNNAVTDRGVCAVLSKVPIRRLSIAFCSAITGRGSVTRHL